MTPYLHIRSFTNDQYYLDKVFYANFYRLKAFKEVESKPVVVDIGAHAGFFSFMALSAGAKGVYAFEPFPSNFVSLVKNLVENPIGPILPYQLGVYPEYKTLNMKVPELKNNFLDFAEIQFAENTIDTQVIPCTFIPLDTILYFYVLESIVDILKISIGGLTTEVLLASEALSKVKNICGEAEVMGASVQALQAGLRGKGFTDFRSSPVIGETNKIVFHASKSKIDDMFLEPIKE